MEKFALYFVSPKCFDKYFSDHDLLDIQCGKELISKCLGYSIIAASMFVKVPQILKILSAKSGQGVSFFAQLLDAVACTSNFTYCFIATYPFSAYGDAVFNFLQTLCIAHLCLHFSGKSIEAFLFTLSCLTAAGFLCSGAATLEQLRWFNSCNLLIASGARGTQIWTNFKNGSTGQLSLVTMALLFIGCIARVFTSIQETNDMQLVTSFATGGFLNGVIVLQILYYGSGQRTKSE